jgi:site-specific DNA-adenine methylase
LDNLHPFEHMQTLWYFVETLLYDYNQPSQVGESSPTLRSDPAPPRRAAEYDLHNFACFIDEGQVYIRQHFSEKVYISKSREFVYLDPEHAKEFSESNSIEAVGICSDLDLGIRREVGWA